MFEMDRSEEKWKKINNSNNQSQKQRKLKYRREIRMIAAEKSNLQLHNSMNKTKIIDNILSLIIFKI